MPKLFGKMLPLLLAVLIHCAPVFAATPEDEMISADEQRLAVLVREDYDTLERILADDLIYTHSSSAVDDKASLMQSFRTGVVKFRKTERFDLRAKVYGETGVLTGRALFQVTVRGQDREVNLRFSTAWVKRAGAWQMVMWQATPIPKP